MSDRIAVMNLGEVEQVDVPQAVYERPATAFVAGFIGVSNLMPATCTRLDGDSADLALDAGVVVTVPADGLRAGARYSAIVRPEKLTLTRASEHAPGDRPSVEGAVQSSAYLGTATQVIVRLAGGVTVTALLPNSEETGRESLPETGLGVRLSWASGHTHVVSEVAQSQPDKQSTEARQPEPAVAGAGGSP